VWIVILAYIGSYLLGAVPVGVLAAKAKGIDIMAHGSGNIGATNVARVLGKKAGIAVFLLDVLKGVVPPVVVAYLPIEGVFGLSVADHRVICGVLAIAGHTLSPFIGFKGGKGIATGLGALLGTAPLVGLTSFGMFLVTFALTRIVSVSSVVAAICVGTFGIFLFPQSRLFQVVYAIVGLYAIIKHRENLKRLVKGEEPKFVLKKPGPPPADVDSDA